MEESTFLYIFVVTVGTGDTGIDRLHELISPYREGVRAKEFTAPHTFLIHAELDLSETLRTAGFAFTMRKLPIGEVHAL